MQYTPDQPSTRIPLPRGHWGIRAFAGALLLFLSIAGFCGYRHARSCLLSEIFHEEIREVFSLRSSLPETGFLLELMDDDVLNERHPFHQRLAGALFPEQASRTPSAALEARLEWLKTLEPLLDPEGRCNGLTSRLVVPWLRDWPEFRELRSTRAGLSLRWNERLTINTGLEREVAQDFAHDQRLLCRSRASLRNFLALREFLDKKCRQSKMSCGPASAEKLQHQARELASVAEVNSAKFGEKWGAKRLEALRCE